MFWNAAAAIVRFWKIAIAVLLSIIVSALTNSALAAIATFLVLMVVVVIFEAVQVVPQQNAWVVERLGKYLRTLEPGLNLIVPFVDRVAYRHVLDEVRLDVPEQACTTKDDTQLAVDGIIHYQVSDPKLASYGSADYVVAITQLAQIVLRTEIGNREFDRTFESRDEINHRVTGVLDEAGRAWGIKVLRYEMGTAPPAR